MMQKVKDWAKNVWHKSWTKALGVSKMLVGGALAAVPHLSSVASDPGVKEVLTKMELPLYVALGLAVLGAITWLSAERA